MGVNNLNKTT